MKHILERSIGKSPYPNKVYFDHVSEYASFEEFKAHVKRFLGYTLKELLNDSFAFSCTSDWQPELQKSQTDTINKVFDELYGTGRVCWMFESYDEEKDNLWGVYLLIDGVKECLYQNTDCTVDEFIRAKLK